MLLYESSSNRQGSWLVAGRPLTNQSWACPGREEAKSWWQAGRKKLASWWGMRASRLRGCQSWRSLGVCCPSSRSGRPTARLPRLPAKIHLAAGGRSFSERQRKHRNRDQTLNPLERKWMTAGENILHIKEHQAKPVFWVVVIFMTWTFTFTQTEDLELKLIKVRPDLRSLQLSGI